MSVVKVGLVIGQLSTGGAERQLCELVPRLDGDRFEAIVYSLTDTRGGMRPALEASGASLRIVGGRGLERVRRLAALLREDGVGLVHSWLFIGNTYAGAASLALPRTALVTSARNCKSQGAVHHLANILAFRRSARIVVNSERVGEYIVRHYGAPRRRISRVYNAVDVDRFRPVVANRAGDPTIVTALRFTEQKNPFLFLDAAAQLASRFPALRFVMLGEGELRQPAIKRAAALGIEGRVEFPGDRMDIESCFQRARLFWLTSSWEGLPNVVLEAMACGLPVIATDVGGTRELLRSGVEGFLVRPAVVEDFVEYGGAVLADDELYARLAAAARRRACQFSLARMVRSMEDVYESALGERP